MIWKKPISLEMLNQLCQPCLVGHLGIEFIQINADSLVAQMPVDERTIQPMGLLHGGASVVLAETLGSVAATFAADHDHYCLGLDINANHLRQVDSGVVVGTVSPVHIGKSTQVWQIHIVDELNRLVCSSRLTLMVKLKKERIASTHVDN